MKTENYKQQQKLLPKQGQYIIGSYDEESIICYQAFNHKIADYAIKNNTFGGSHYSFTRMTWLKPNFMWMMYRAGWATKPNQERILAIKIKKEGFLQILEEAVHSSFKPHLYDDHEEWKKKLASSEVRLQWDPDHTPNGEKLERKAIQLGIKGDMMQKFVDEWVISIEDITEFVTQQKAILDLNENELEVPVERVLDLENHEIISNNINLSVLKKV